MDVAATVELETWTTNVFRVIVILAFSMMVGLILWAIRELVCEFGAELREFGADIRRALGLKPAAPVQSPWDLPK